LWIRIAGALREPPPDAGLPTVWRTIHRGERWLALRIAPSVCLPRETLGDIAIHAEVTTDELREPLPLTVHTPAVPFAVRVAGGELAFDALARHVLSDGASPLPDGVTVQAVEGCLEVTGPGGRMLVYG
jgi:hypothetical protein